MDKYNLSQNSPHYSTIVNNKIINYDKDLDDPDWIVKQAHVIVFAAASKTCEKIKIKWQKTLF